MAKRRSRVGRRTMQATRSGVAEGLTASSGKVALIGLVTAVATLGFTVWQQVSLHEHGDVRMPLAQAAMHLEAAISQSVSATRGWVAHADPEARGRRAEIWQDQVVPQVEALRRIASAHRDKETAAQVEALAADLRQLERWLLVVEDVAHAPGNEPARMTYEEEVVPISHSILQILQVHGFGLPGGMPSQVRLRIAEYRAAIIEIDRALLGLLEADTDARRGELDFAMKQAELKAEGLRAALEPLPTSDFTAGLTYALNELGPFVERCRHAAAQRQAPNWNLAQHTHRTSIAPLLARLEASAEALEEAQNDSMHAAAKLMRRWGAVVVALALLMGLLSAGSLYVSMRVRYRMQQVLAKARMLGQYAIEERLGGGGMGEVYRAKHAMLRRPTAIKLLRSKSAQDPRAQERFREEVQLTSQLTHPNTIQVFDYGQTPDGYFYYAMELLEGVNLDLLVQVTGPMPVERAVHVVLQICGSLGEAHDKGLLHRDIKPGNIMLTERGGVFDTAKVLDFGLVQRVERDDGSEGLAGTPMFMAPELIRDEGRASPRSDLYALGGVAYHLLTGRYPFDAEEPAQILRHQLEVTPARPSARLGRGLHEGVEAVVMSCLAKDPAERPESAEHLAELLRACACGAWSNDAAKAWWLDYGEALRAEASGPRSMDSELASGLRVARSTATLP